MMREAFWEEQKKMEYPQKERYDFNDLVEIVRILRAPGGCPWDMAQTHRSIRSNFIEETYEAIEAIDTGDTALLREELGDVLLQVALHTEMEREAGSFDMNDVCDDLCKKLIVRHPHVFGDKSAANEQQALQNWDAVKMELKQQKSQTEAMNSVSRALPALMRSEKVQRKSAKVGFDWDTVDGALDKLYEEYNELKVAIEHGTDDNRCEELGDLLFSVVNVSRYLDINSEQALYKACDKYIRRFSMVEQLALERGIDMKSAELSQLDSLWEEVKILQKHKSNGGN